MIEKEVFRQRYSDPQCLGRSNILYPTSFNEKIPFFNDFMRRYSKTTYRRIRNKLLHFTLFLEDHYDKNILEADINDVLSYFKDDIDKRNILRESKSKFRDALNAYYKYVKEIKEKIEKTLFINPVPSLNLFDFTEKDLLIEDLEKKEDLLTYEVVERVLNYTYWTRKRCFIITSLLLYSGARVSEICRIKIKNIDFEERYFYTKVKSKKALNRWGIYFFPKFFVPYLKEWISQIEAEYNDPIFLFPSPYTNSQIMPKTPWKNLRVVKNDLGIKARLNPHSFRDFINTERFDKDLNAKFRCLLLNQTPKNVNVKNYLKKYKKRKELLKIYDETLPFPEFNPKDLI